jgi:energy-coupling factor transporter ATP-binding protein EcfA2
VSIDRVRLSRFTVFDELNLELSRGLNVLIGINGSGKSHLMKATYASIKPFEDLEVSAGTQTHLAAKIQMKLGRVFRPDDYRVGRLVRRRRGVDSAQVAIEGGEGSVQYEFSTRADRHLTLEKQEWKPKAKALFIPSREALAMYEGFVSAYQNQDLSFDETYYDLCVALSGNPLRGPREERAKTLREPVERALGGRVVRKGNRFYVQMKAKLSWLGNCKVALASTAEPISGLTARRREARHHSAGRG